MPNMERLNRLDAMLTKIAENETKQKQFDLGTWISLPVVSLDHCGTTACAGGWMTQEVGFREMGLRYDGYEPKLLVPSGIAWGDGFNSLARLLDLDIEGSVTLFSPGGYQGVELYNPLAVRARLRELYDTNGTIPEGAPPISFVFEGGGE
jgi:hypothetical protein